MTRQWKIEVRYRDAIPDAVGRGLIEDVRDLGIGGVRDIRTAQVYWLRGDLDADVVERLCRELLTDAVTQVYHYEPLRAGPEQMPIPSCSDCWTVEVRYKPGVTDTVSESVMKGIRDMGICGVQEVHTGHQYVIAGKDLLREDVERIGKHLLANELIQTIALRTEGTPCDTSSGR